MQPYIFDSKGGNIVGPIYWIVTVESPLGAQWRFDNGVVMPIIKARQAPHGRPWQIITFSNISVGASTKVLACHDCKEPFVGLDTLPPNAAQAVVTSFARKEWFSLIRAGLAFGCTFAITKNAAQGTNFRIANPPNSNFRILIYYAGAVCDVVNSSVAALLDSTGTANQNFGGSLFPANLLTGGATPNAKLTWDNFNLGTGNLIKIQNCPIAFTEYPLTLSEGFFYELLSNHNISFGGVVQAFQASGNVPGALLNVGIQISLLWAEVPLNYA